MRLLFGFWGFFRRKFGISGSVFGKQFAVGCDARKFQSFSTIVICCAINSTRTSWLLLKCQTNSIAAVETLAATFNGAHPSNNHSAKDKALIYTKSSRINIQYEAIYKSDKYRARTLSPSLSEQIPRQQPKASFPAGLPSDL